MDTHVFWIIRVRTSLILYQILYNTLKVYLFFYVQFMFTVLFCGNTCDDYASIISSILINYFDEIV